MLRVRHRIVALVTLPLAACLAPTTANEAGNGARADLYHCEGCAEALARAPAQIASRVALTGPDEPGERLVISGRVLMFDGKTPAPGVIIYAHQTDASGLYQSKTQGPGGRAAGAMIEGWARSDAEGRYRFDTIKPAPYPSASMPAHIHLYIGEPDRRAYYVDDVVFAGEFAVDDAYRARQELRGGSGIVTLSRTAQGEWLAQRDIVLERHP